MRRRGEDGERSVLSLKEKKRESFLKERSSFVEKQKKNWAKLKKKKNDFTGSWSHRKFCDLCLEVMWFRGATYLFLLQRATLFATTFYLGSRPTFLSLSIRPSNLDTVTHQRHSQIRTTMALWVDKHRPSNLDKLDYHTDLSAHLKKLVHFQD